jgi:hypothetical protein
MTTSAGGRTPRPRASSRRLPGIGDGELGCRVSAAGRDSARKESTTKTGLSHGTGWRRPAWCLTRALGFTNVAIYDGAGTNGIDAIPKTEAKNHRGLGSGARRIKQADGKPKLLSGTPCLPCSSKHWPQWQRPESCSGDSRLSEILRGRSDPPALMKAPAQNR